MFQVFCFVDKRMIVINLIISIFFFLVPISYYFFIDQLDVWWFKMSDFIPIKMFVVSATFAAIGFVYIEYFMIFGLESFDHKLTTEYTLILLSTLAWAPLTFLSLKVSRKFKYFVVFGLGVTAGCANAFLFFLFDRQSQSFERDVAIVAMTLFTLHVTIMDFCIWNYFFLTNLG